MFNESGDISRDFTGLLLNSWSELKYSRTLVTRTRITGTPCLLELTSISLGFDHFSVILLG